MLHAQILHVFNAYETSDNKQQVLVLVTGDGNNNEDKVNFVKVVETALKKHWNVELWAWENSMSKKYLEVQKHFPIQMNIQYLDFYREQITFIQKPKQV